MNSEQAADSLEALGNATRLEVFRLLVQVGEQGAPVGEIQKALKIPPSTLSHHIARLMRVDLVTQQRQSRVLICRANYDTMNELLGFLTDNCCGGISLPRQPVVA